MSVPAPLALAGRRAIVTGAGSGIGAACARALAAQGAAIAVLDIREAAAVAVAGELAAEGARTMAIACDVASETAVEDAVGAAADRLGGVELVVAAAGIARGGRLDEMALETWEATIRVNLTGVFLTLKHTLPHLVAAGGGAIVTIGSVASLVAAGRSVSYDAAKGGVLQLTRGVAAEYADRGVRANCVCPGIVATGLAENSEQLYGPAGRSVEIPAASRTRPLLERPADAAEIASVVAFICSDAASFITGAAIPVDGGYTAV